MRTKLTINLAALLMLNLLCACRIPIDGHNGIANVISNFDETSGNRIKPSGVYVTTSHSFNDIDEIEASRGVHVIYTQSSNTSVKVVADKAVNEYVRLNKDGTTLKISIDTDKSITSTNGDKSLVTVHLSAPVIYDIELSSTGKFSTDKPINIGNRDFEIETSSCGSVSIPGITCKELDIEAISASAITINNIECNKISIEASSASNIEIKGITSNRIDAEASSSSSITLEGTAESVEFKASSTASIKAASLKAKRGTLEASSIAQIESSVANATQSTSSMGSIRNK